VVGESGETHIQISFKMKFKIGIFDKIEYNYKLINLFQIRKMWIPDDLQHNRKSDPRKKPVMILVKESWAQHLVKHQCKYRRQV